MLTFAIYIRIQCKQQKDKEDDGAHVEITSTNLAVAGHRKC